jgi:glycerate 2-kinase
MIAFHRGRLREHPHGDAQLRSLKAALAAIDPAKRITDQLTVADNVLHIDHLVFPLEGRRIWILSIGKASVPMARAVEDLLAPKCAAGGVAVTRAGYGGPTRSLQVIEAGHPLPRTVVGADAVIEIAKLVKPEDLVLCLLSGGGSALLACPPVGVQLSDLAHTTELLLHSGVTIDEMNTVRRHVSRLQGGQLMSLLYPATVVTLILSDVIGDRLESIASGPTVSDPTTFSDACSALDRVGLLDRVPSSVRAHLLSGRASEVPETPKPGDPIFENVHTLLIGNNKTAVDALASSATSEGFEVHRHPLPLVGEARGIGFQLADRAREMAGQHTTKWALIAGGETTVTLQGDGLGGRNQELALAAALRLEGVAGVSFASLATDGTDGPTDAAGALVDGDTAALARQQGMDPRAALDRNDSHRALASTKDLLWTGPTNTNVADVVLVLGDPTA